MHEGGWFLTLQFHGDLLPSFVKVTRIYSSLLPTMEASRDTSNSITKLRGREFQVEYFITSSSREDLMRKARLFGEWLYTEKSESLILPHEKDKTYTGKIEGSTEIHTFNTMGRGTVTFVCEPYAISNKEKKVLVQRKKIVWVNNEGSVEAFPIIDLTFQKKVDHFMISNSTDWMSFGSTHPVDKQELGPKRKKVLHDDGTSRVGWTGGIGVDGGVITGDLESTGGYLQTAGKEYGESTMWHGPAGVKMWDHGITDFTLEATIGFKSIYMYQIGRVEIYLLDENQVRIGKIGLRDAHASIHNPVLESRIGPVSGGVFFAKKELGRGRGNDFYGKVILSRSGSRWKVELTKISGKGAGKKWTEQITAKIPPVEVHGIQIHFGAYGKHQPYSTAYIQNIRMWEEHALKDKIYSIPGFEEGDRLLIDSSTGTIKRNGAVYYENLDPRSSFLRLPKGRSKISFAPKAVEGKVTFRERSI